MIHDENFGTQLAHTAFLQRENGSRHLAYEAEMRQYDYLKQAHPDAVKVCIEAFKSPEVGYLSDNPLRNRQYLFICFITLATRFVVDGGMSTELAYNTSDLFIQRVDKCTTIESVNQLQAELVHYYYKKMSELNKASVYSKPIIQSMDYIYYHLHQNIRVTELAAHVHLNPTYLSTLFKKEVGMSISAYVQEKRIEAAKNMLSYSDYSYSDISNYLAFSSQSYFVSVFHKQTGLTPKQYRQVNFRIGFRGVK